MANMVEKGKALFLLANYHEFLFFSYSFSHQFFISFVPPTLTFISTFPGKNSDSVLVIEACFYPNTLASEHCNQKVPGLWFLFGITHDVETAIVCFFTLRTLAIK